jgi:3-deoxy-D-manno-octulosonic-acid transferase
MMLYRLVLATGLVAYAPYAFARESLGGKKVGDWRARFGLTPLPNFHGSIWIHGVSVGEVNAARPILEAIREQAADVPRVLSASTAAGLAVAATVTAADASVAFPFDLARPVERALSALDPSLVLLTETEIWPLFLERCERRGVPVAIVNGRISSRSFSRYRRARRWLAASLSRIALFVMQTDEDAERVRALDVPAGKIVVTGNVKFDVAPPDDPAVTERIRAWARGRRVIVAGSTHEGEEAAVLDAWGTLDPRPLLVIAPRRPERFDEVFRLLGARGTVARRYTEEGERDVVLLNSVGELASVFAAADAAFIGGTLVPAGGHNPIEAWAHGVPTVFGPHVANMRASAEAGIAAGAAIVAPTAADLAPVLRSLLADEVARRVRSAAAADLVARHRGAARETARAVLALRKSA